MTDADIIAWIDERARLAFNEPSLRYDSGLAFRDVRGYDSVRAVMLILSLEEAFGVTFEAEEVDRIFTMGDLFRFLQEELS